MPNSNLVRLFHLSLRGAPVTTVAYQVEVGNPRTTESEAILHFAVTSLNPKDKWKRSQGNKIALGRFTKQDNIMNIFSSNENLTKVKIDILQFLATTNDPRVCLTTRRAAKEAWMDMTGESIRDKVLQDVARFLRGGAPRKIEHKRKLIETILQQCAKDVHAGALPEVKRSR